VRGIVERTLQSWKLDTPKKPADGPLISDAIRFRVFDSAFKEISILTYQNLWNNYRAAELQQMALTDESSSKIRRKQMALTDGSSSKIRRKISIE
jgi:hypothetical protein